MKYVKLRKNQIREEKQMNITICTMLSDLTLPGLRLKKGDKVLLKSGEEALIIFCENNKIDNFTFNLLGVGDSLFKLLENSHEEKITLK